MLVQAEVSLYPMGEADPAPAIYGFVRRLERPGLTVTPGPLSTLVTGEAADVFAALGEAYEALDATGRAALLIKMIRT